MTPRLHDSENERTFMLGLSQKARLLAAFQRAYPGSLTDEQAASRAGLLMIRTCCWWKRCSELRRDGYIARANERRKGSAGMSRMTSRYVPALPPTEEDSEPAGSDDGLERAACI